jgi:hypothetical protein
MPIPVTTVRGSTTSGSRFTFREEQATIWSRFWVIRPHEEKCTLIVVFDGYDEFAAHTVPDDYRKRSRTGSTPMTGVREAKVIAAALLP